jgi:hypothetical protein
MSNSITLSPTSRSTARTQDFPLRSSDSSGADTRRVAVPLVVDNAKVAAHSVKVTLIHQRKGRSGRWEDCPPFNQATLKVGQEVRFALDTQETWDLYQGLKRLYALRPELIRGGERTLLVHDADDVHILEGKAREIALDFERHGTKMWEAIDAFRPDVLGAVAEHVRLKQRRQAVARFRRHMRDRDWPEPMWDDFFEANLWMFGHALGFQILRDVQRQPVYGGVTVSGAGANRGDRLMASDANARFAVLVELKRPDTLLLFPKPYRNDAYRVSDELAGGVAQLQANCRTWVTEGARTDKNRREMERRGVETYEPRAILVIGDCAQLDTPEKRASFEMYRRNTRNPEIVTYDEVLARAEFLVGMRGADAQ